MFKKIKRLKDIFFSLILINRHSFTFEDVIVFKSLKESDLYSYGYIWIVNDYINYPYYREKFIAGKNFPAGIGYTVNYLERINSNIKILKILTITFDSYSQINYDKYKSSCYDIFDIILFVPNFGRDLGAHKYTLLFLNKYNINPCSKVILSNSSFVPNNNICNINFWDCINHYNNAILGSSYCFGPKYFIKKYRHLQSFYLVLNYKYYSCLFSSINFRNNTKDHVIRNGEVEIVNLATKFGIDLFICYDGFSFYLWGPGEFRYVSYDHRLKSF